MLALSSLSRSTSVVVHHHPGPPVENTVIVVPDAPLVNAPVRIAGCTIPTMWPAVIEGIALPLVHTAWVTALCFTVATRCC